MFRCFYHGWVYNIRGELKGIPGEEAYSDAFDRDALGLEPAPRMHIHRGCIFVSFDPEIESFASYMGDALAVLDNTLDLGDMEFVDGQFKYSMRANWKLLVENSMDGYHAAYTHERFFSQWMPSEGLGSGFTPPPLPSLPVGAAANARRGTVPLGNGHVTTFYPNVDGRPDVSRGFLEKHAGADLSAFREGLVRRHGAEKARMVEGRRRQLSYLSQPDHHRWLAGVPNLLSVKPRLHGDQWLGLPPEGGYPRAQEGPPRLVSRVSGPGRVRHPGRRGGAGRLPNGFRDP